MTAPPGPIDVHTHVVPPTLPTLLDRWWPASDVADTEGRTLHFRSGNRRRITPVATDMAVRLADMDERGIAAHVLSVMPGLSACVLSDAKEASEAAEAVNDFLVSCVETAPGRFRAFATLPIAGGPPLDLIDRLLETPEIIGFQVTTSAVQALLATGSWGDVAERVSAGGGWLFLHPHDGAVADAWDLVSRLPVAGCGMTAHTAITALELLPWASGAESTPALLLAHGGGSLPFHLPRLDRLWEFTAARAALPDLPSTLVREYFYIDSCVQGTPSLRLAVEAMPASRCFFGSDYPFPIQVSWDDIDELELSYSHRAGISWQNVTSSGLFAPMS